VDAAAGAAGELAGRGRGAFDDGGDLVERHGEHVVQHEREPFGGCERAEHDEQGGTDGVDHHGPVCRVGGVGGGRRGPGVQGFLAPCPA
jgi:hypothetical protein